MWDSALLLCFFFSSRRRHTRWRNQCSFGPKADQARRHSWNPRRSHRGKEDRKNFGPRPNCIRLHGNRPTGLGGRLRVIQTSRRERRGDRKENGGLTKMTHSREAVPSSAVL